MAAVFHRAAAKAFVTRSSNAVARALAMVKVGLDSAASRAIVHGGDSAADYIRHATGWRVA